MHYRAKTAILNNLEYDHADIFPDLGAIETQFHHLVRTVPGVGRVVANAEEESLRRVLKRGCWSELEWFGNGDDAQWALRKSTTARSSDIQRGGPRLRLLVALRSP